MYTEQQLQEIESKFSASDMDTSIAKGTIIELAAEVRRLMSENNNLNSGLATKQATSNVAREIINNILSGVEKQLKINKGMEDELGQKIVDDTMLDIKARLESALRVL